MNDVIELMMLDELLASREVVFLIYIVIKHYPHVSVIPLMLYIHRFSRMLCKRLSG